MTGTAQTMEMEWFHSGRARDWALAIGALTLVAVVMIPLPTWLLDLFWTLTIAVAVAVWLAALYVSDPLQFAVFPGFLLLYTLFRLGLNMATARLILLQADAGQLIQAFGALFIRGNELAGLALFTILLIVQWVVVSNGVGRVAEVAARFMLDALPGKQMSLDAAVSAGVLTPEEAHEQRRLIQLEADFYGAMDGASKFVKGDIIAAVLILVVNLVGGMGTGVFLHRLPLSDALTRYVLLAVGAGMVAQLPALLLATAMGVLVTRSAAVTDAGRGLLHEVLLTPRMFAVLSGVLLAFALVPALPQLPFGLLGGGLGWVAYRLHQMQKPAPAGHSGASWSAPAQRAPAEVDLASELQIEPLCLEVGYGLLPLLDPAQPENLLERILAVRRQLSQHLGFVVPAIQVRDAMALTPESYVIRLRGEEVAHGTLLLKRYLALEGGTPSASADLAGIPALDPVTGMPARWIAAEHVETAQAAGYTVLDPVSVLMRHLAAVIEMHAPTLLSRQAVQRLLDRVRQEEPALVEDAVPALLTVGEIQRVLQNLLAERVSILDLPAILESIVYHARETRDPDALSEKARVTLARSLCNRYKGKDGALHVIHLGPVLAQTMAEALPEAEGPAVIHLRPAVAQKVLDQMNHAVQRLVAEGITPVVLCDRPLRLPLWRMVAGEIPDLVVMAYDEVVPGIQVRSDAVVEIDRIVVES